MNATYHGITKATCLSCNKITTDISELELMNDLDNLCSCGDRFTQWEDKDGGIIITCEIEDFKGNRHYFREETTHKITEEI
jgi:hypothetical protein